MKKKPPVDVWTIHIPDNIDTIRAAVLRSPHNLIHHHIVSFTKYLHLFVNNLWISDKADFNFSLLDLQINMFVIGHKKILPSLYQCPLHSNKVTV